ncbi:hypothetical protein [Shewanella sp. UCD-KL12]|uniref:hypothetical protein n=1 Tax=Shewanella sp. UCD-KL12 TaxID=1917163 RepID=UPI000970302E|nr:hypothetical protein [Shewanella sp. UCD-KL12]
MSITNQVNHIKPKLNFTVNQHLYETSNPYRCRVDYVIKLLAGDELCQTNEETYCKEDVINLEKDFILGYN